MRRLKRRLCKENGKMRLEMTLRVGICLRFMLRDTILASKAIL